MINKKNKLPIEEENIKALPKTKKTLKKNIDTNKFFEPIKDIIPFWSEFEKAVWEDILLDLLIIYSWRVPSSMASQGVLLPLLETVFFSFLTLFYGNVLNVPLKVPKVDKKKTKGTLTHDVKNKIKKEDIN